MKLIEFFISFHIFFIFLGFLKQKIFVGRARGLGYLTRRAGTSNRKGASRRPASHKDVAIRQRRSDWFSKVVPVRDNDGRPIRRR